MLFEDEVARQITLFYDREHFSNTDLSDLRIVGTCNTCLPNASPNHVISPIGCYCNLFTPLTTGGGVKTFFS